MCCEKPKRVEALIDCIFIETGIRFRHLPGEICFSCRDISIPDIIASPSLARSVSDCIDGDPTNLLIIKSRPRETDNDELGINNHYKPVFLDIGIGENSGLIVENIKGSWNSDLLEATISDDGAELRNRLLKLNEPGEFKLAPSLAYDTPQHPNSVQIELTTRCNLSCSYCSHRDLPEKRDAPLQLIMRILDNIDFPKVNNVDFTGLGEPILHPNLPEIIKEIRQRNKQTDIRVVTNGTALTPLRFKAICEAGITSIAFSIDSLDAGRFAKSRGGADLQKVINNLEALVDYRNRNLKDLEIKIKAVLIDAPYAEAEELLKFSAKLGLEMPHFSCLDNREIAKVQYQEPWLHDNWASEGGSDFNTWAEKRWKKLTASFPTKIRPKPSPEAEFINPVIHPSSHLCRWAIDAVFISASGHMLSCCEQMIDIPRNYKGSILDKPLFNLWHDDLLWSYRLPLSLGMVPNECEGCPLAPA